MRTRLLALLFAVCSAGCVHARVRTEAAPTLDCPETRIAVHEETSPGTYTATGCGRAAVCTLPAVSGAEVQCVGGPMLTARSL